MSSFIGLLSNPPRKYSLKCKENQVLKRGKEYKNERANKFSVIVIVKSAVIDKQKKEIKYEGKGERTPQEHQCDG